MNKVSRRLPRPGDVYKHFKGNIVVIETISKHTETGEILITYRHNDNVWSRPFDMFMSKVDKEKYPEVTQTYRFEKELPHNITKTTEFIQIVEDLSTWKDFQNYTKEELEKYVLEHYFI